MCDGKRGKAEEKEKTVIQFGHLPKYYPPILVVSLFTKVLSLQNFVSYGIRTLKYNNRIVVASKKLHLSHIVYVGT